MTSARPDRTGRAVALATGATLAFLLGGCSPSPAPASPGAATPSAGPTTEDGSVPTPVRTGRTAASERVRFVPTSIVLPGAAPMRVVPATTRQGVLAVPDDLAVAGWWDGGAWAGDPYGTTVIAANVDSAEKGVGLFADLLDVTPGAVVTVRAGRRHAAYRVTTTKTVLKQALVTGTKAFDQRGPHRLVLVTCTGRFDPATRSYDSNFVVFAEPVGPAA